MRPIGDIEHDMENTGRELEPLLKQQKLLAKELRAAIPEDEDEETPKLHLNGLKVEQETKDAIYDWITISQKSQASLINALVIHAMRTNFNPVTADVSWKEGK